MSERFFMPAPPESVQRVTYTYYKDGSLRAAKFHFDKGSDSPGEWIVQDDRDPAAEAVARNEV